MCVGHLGRGGGGGWYLRNCVLFVGPFLLKRSLSFSGTCRIGQPDSLQLAITREERKQPQVIWAGAATTKSDRREAKQPQVMQVMGWTATMNCWKAISLFPDKIGSHDLPYWVDPPNMGLNRFNAILCLNTELSGFVLQEMTLLSKNTS